MTTSREHSPGIREFFKDTFPEGGLSLLSRLKDQNPQAFGIFRSYALAFMDAPSKNTAASNLRMIQLYTCDPDLSTTVAVANLLTEVAKFNKSDADNLGSTLAKIATKSGSAEIVQMTLRLIDARCKTGQLINTADAVSLARDVCANVENKIGTARNWVVSDLTFRLGNTTLRKESPRQNRQ
jgi:hypothetical protein